MHRRQRDFAVIGWASFLIASASTMVFFALIDPKALSRVSETALPHGRMAGYALGFFFFWAMTALAAALTVYLIRTRQGHPPPRD
jgi:hypothetical protein